MADVLPVIPGKISKDIDEIKTASNRILVTVLLMAVIALWYRLSSVERRCINLEIQIEKLKDTVIMKSESENKALRNIIAVQIIVKQQQDSVKESLQRIINNTNKKRK